jgi:hypothetical protein
MVKTIPQKLATIRTRKSRSAAAPAAGFEYQFERMLYHLAISQPDTLIGIETDDDVSFTHNSVTTLEQDKYVVKAKKNPFTNNSENLWKTLLIWSNCLNQSQNKIYRFLFATNNTIKRNPSSLVWKIADATSKTESLKCITELRNTKNSTNEKIAKIMDQVKNCNNEILEEIIINTSVADNTKMQDADLIRLLEPPDGINGMNLLITMRGWLRSIVMNNWASGNAGLVKRQQYVNAKDRHCETQKRFRKLERPYRDIIISEEDKISCVSKIFVEQIVALQITPENIAADEIEVAIEDYIRFYTENSRLLEEGEITDHEWNVFFDGLKNRWRGIRNRNLSRTGKNFSPEEHGRDIFNETLKQDHKAKLAEQDTSEQYITNGGYHVLADGESIRWHPHYSSTYTMPINNR